ncbi:MAG: hypothetical protein ACE37F_27500 [Nannocystaceae bacterium]|nr:hypothetical protein [bacterium]
MRSNSLRKTALSLLIGLPVLVGSVGCDPPPAATPDDAAPATADAPPASTDEAPAAEPAAETPAQDANAGVDQGNLPKAEELFAANVEAVGGKAKIETIKTFYREDTMEIPAQKIKITNKMWWSGGDFYAEADMPGMGVTKIWKVGDALWSKDPINGMRQITGKELEQQLRSNELVVTANWQAHFSKAETKARRMVDGKPVIDVVLTTNGGEEVTMSFDEETKLLVEQAFVQDTPQGKIPMKSINEEYKDFDGFMVPVKSTVDMTVAKIVGNVVTFELNPKIEKGKIKLPAEAKAKK